MKANINININLEIVDFRMETSLGPTLAEFMYGPESVHTFVIDSVVDEIVCEVTGNAQRMRLRFIASWPNQSAHHVWIRHSLRKARLIAAFPRPARCLQHHLGDAEILHDHLDDRRRGGDFRDPRV